MNRIDQERFIDRELKGLWPRWQPGDAELSIWAGELAPLAYDQARAALRACFREQTVNYHGPVIARFLAKMRGLLHSTSKRPTCAKRDPQTRVFVECLEPPAEHPHLAGTRRGVYVQRPLHQDDLDSVRAAAESMRRQFAQLYGGHWIVVVEKPPSPNEAQWLGAPARQQAFKKVLAGPDTPGRRWLTRLLAARESPRPATQKPAQPSRTTAQADPEPLANAIDATWTTLCQPA